MKLKVECSKVTDGLLLGDSIAVNGVCLTAVSFGSSFFEADISYETIAKTSLNNIRSGSVVNLESINFIIKAWWSYCSRSC